MHTHTKAYISHTHTLTHDTLIALAKCGDMWGAFYQRNLLKIWSPKFVMVIESLSV